MRHYACPICGGAADHPKVCETPGCEAEGHELMECHCTDGKHEDVKKRSGEGER